jgi:hypothetical protein
MPCVSVFPRIVDTVQMIAALTLDLDDTLWPVMPTLLRAEADIRNCHTT